MSASTSNGAVPEAGDDSEHDNEAQTVTQPKKPDMLEQDAVTIIFGYHVTRQQFLKYVLNIYMFYFGIHRAAELAYIGTVDARFPHGLEHLYHSEAQRKVAVSYIRQSVICGMLRECANFAIIMLLVRSGILPKFDEALGCFLQATSRTLQPCLRWCGCCSRLLCCPCRCAQANIISWHDLFRGTLFLQALAVLFFVANLPFRIWLYKINVYFGFVNTLTVPYGLFLWMQVMQLKKLITSGFIMVMLKLPFLKARWGWLFLWVCMMCAVVVLQTQPQAALGAEFNMIQNFPNFFGVGRNFPLLKSPKANGPWLSANRIYYEQSPPVTTPPKTAAASTMFETRDRNVAPLTLQDDEKHQRMTLFDSNHSLLAQSQGASSAVQNWMVNGNTESGARVGFRKGKQLRDELLALARKRDIGIGQVIMIDGSSTDTRANAFVAGAGENRVVGLYDTLFLGDGPTRETPEAAVSLFTFAGGEVDMDHVQEAITGVDTRDAGNDRQPLWHRDTTVPMSDGEVLAILGHELGHSALHHVESKVVGLSVSSFVSFAVWGWMALSPLVSSAFAFLEPSIHCGVFAFDHIVGPPLEGFFSFIGNTIARRHEYQADAYSAEISEAYARDLQSSLANLAVSSNEDPDTPFFWEMLHNSHPSVAKRWAAVEEVKRRVYGNSSALIQAAQMQNVTLGRRQGSAAPGSRLRKQAASQTGLGWAN